MTWYLRQVQVIFLRTIRYRTKYACNDSRETTIDLEYVILRQLLSPWTTFLLISTIPISHCNYRRKPYTHTISIKPSRFLCGQSLDERGGRANNRGKTKCHAMEIRVVWPGYNEISAPRCCLLVRCCVQWSERMRERKTVDVRPPRTPTKPQWHPSKSKWVFGFVENQTQFRVAPFRAQ